MKKITKILSALLLSVMAVFVLTACVPSNAEKAKTKMKEDGYTVAAYSVFLIDGAEEGITATDYDDGKLESVTAIWFESVDDAKEYYSNFEESDSELVKRSGKCVYFGTADAIEDFED
ncbi:MAG: hypothetical protein IJA97_00935 [Clostridia bacterium]|nr:hypothetical protein [Clostridia bacterium]